MWTVICSETEWQLLLPRERHKNVEVDNYLWLLLFIMQNGRVSKMNWKKQQCSAALFEATAHLVDCKILAS